MPRNAQLHWRHWNPGLDNDHWTLGEVLGTLPGAEAVEIPWIIRVLENPSSWVALPGAITLARHDAIHVLLGRGLTVQDEAFVIGFTMGATKRLRRWQRKFFAWASSRLYPKVYRFSEKDLIVYEMGVNAAEQMRAKDLQDFPFEDHQGDTLRDLRQSLGIDPHRLRAYYAKERLVRPVSKTSKRLDTDFGGLDATDIRPPEGEASTWKRAPKKKAASSAPADIGSSETTGGSS